MIDYRNLPVGRSRRLAYSINIENRRRVREMLMQTHNIQRHIQRLRNRPIERYIQIQNYNMNRFRHVINISPIHRTTTTFTFFELNNLENVKNGLINKNLLLYSKIKKNVEKDNICIICQDIIDIGDIITTINCNHSFHTNCINTWFTDNKNCPTCKFILE